jgi:hypothetical protein
MLGAVPFMRLVVGVVTDGGQAEGFPSVVSGGVIKAVEVIVASGSSFSPLNVTEKFGFSAWLGNALDPNKIDPRVLEPYHLSRIMASVRSKRSQNVSMHMTVATVCHIIPHCDPINSSISSSLTTMLPHFFYRLILIGRDCNEWRG